MNRSAAGPSYPCASNAASSPGRLRALAAEFARWKKVIEVGKITAD